MFSDIEQLAFKYLAQREHSSFELQQKLKRKFPGQDDVVSEVLASLQKHNWQSESRFISTFIRSRANKGYGLYYILPALKAHNISRDMVNCALEELSIDWTLKAKEVYQKKYGTKAVKNQQDKQSRQKFMGYRGFCFDDYSKLLD